MRSFAAVLVASLGLVAFAAPAQAVTLVKPDGTPVGGQWQKWVDEMRVPTISGTLVFVVDNAACYNRIAPGCSFRSGTPETWVAPGSTSRATLYFELGHQFDWRYLTFRTRRYLARAWEDMHVRWWDTRSWLQYGENGLEGVFPQIYADCATGLNDKGGSVTVFEPFGADFTAPTANPRINTCRFIDKIARRAQADMESARLAPWNRSTWNR